MGSGGQAAILAKSMPSLQHLWWLAYVREQLEKQCLPDPCPFPPPSRPVVVLPPCMERCQFSGHGCRLARPVSPPAISKPPLRLTPLSSAPHCSFSLASMRDSSAFSSPSSALPTINTSYICCLAHRPPSSLSPVSAAPLLTLGPRAPPLLLMAAPVVESIHTNAGPALPCPARPVWRPSR